MRKYTQSLPKSISTSLDNLESAMRKRRNSFANDMTRAAFGQRFPDQSSDGFVDLTPAEVEIRRQDAEMRKSGVAI